VQKFHVCLPHPFADELVPTTPKRETIELFFYLPNTLCQNLKAIQLAIQIYFPMETREILWSVEPAN
jgi:hypothetical protein